MKSPFGAIETVYRGVTFRSRLEAKWAAFFDLCQWKWEYEPIDLNGYIPDFILTFPNAPILVEVKPALYLKDLNQFTEKIDASGWDKESMVVGASMFACDFGDESALGILKEIRNREDVEFGSPDNCWAPAVFQKCQNCNAIHSTIKIGPIIAGLMAVTKAITSSEADTGSTPKICLPAHQGP